MALFLIKREDGNYQEILHISCIVETNSHNAHYKLEKRLVPEGVFTPFMIRNSYELESLEDIVLIEDLFKKGLSDMVKEVRDRKKKNHRAKVPNITLWNNEDKIFDTEDFDKLWNLSDEMLQEKVDGIRFKLIGNGTVHNAGLKMGYLI